MSKEETEYEFIGRTSVNNGVQGFTEHLDFLPNPKNTFCVIQIGEIISQFRHKEWYSSQNIFLLIPNKIKFIDCYNFIVASINKGLKIFSGGYSSYPTLEKLKVLKIKLPIKDENLGDDLENIDFKFMEDFIAELEAQRIAELEAYLIATNLKDYNLTDDEKFALKEFENLEWQEFKIGDLFERISTKKLPYKARELPTKPTKNYILPCLTSSFNNQGLNYYAPKENATILKNVITIPSNSDVYRAYFQSNDFTVLSDAYAIKCKNNIKFLNDHYLFAVMCINKVTDLPIYSYKMKLGGWNVVKNKFINLPTKNGEINYKFMQNFIKAIEKLVIKDVVKFSDKKIKTTKSIVEN